MLLQVIKLGLESGARRMRVNRKANFLIALRNASSANVARRPGTFGVNERD
jgi:hypothetical protein